MLFSDSFSIKVDDSRCLNQIHQGVECTHCVKHCPAEAIFVLNGRIHIDRDTCTGCGLCLSDCPTQVFADKQWDETIILADIQEEEWTNTEFFCARHPQPYKFEKGIHRGAVQLPVCLCAVSAEAWFAIALWTHVEFHLEQCDSCPMEKGLPRFHFKVGMAAEWLEASGQAVPFSFLNESIQGKVKKKWKAMETGLKLSSRRDLFLALAGKKPNKESRMEPFESLADKGRIIPRRNCLPEWKKQLAKVYPKKGLKSETSAYWPTITIDPSCVNCGMCSEYCPTGTLRIAVDEGKCVHNYTSAYCLDCRICELFCPLQAIQRDREPVENPFVDSSIYTAEIMKCRRCGHTTFNNTDHLCYWCKKSEVNENELTSSCHKIFVVGD